MECYLASMDSTTLPNGPTTLEQTSAHEYKHTAKRSRDADGYRDYARAALRSIGVPLKKGKT